MFFSKKLISFIDLKHCFFSRKNGFSKGIYKGLNCGRGSNDNKKNITKNLNYVSKKMGIKSFNLILMYQTHSNKVIEVKKNFRKKKFYADAMVTKVKGIALGVVTADCVPILLYDKKSKIVGCIHAGWRGAYSGIIKNTIKKIKTIGGSNNIFASIGPCIGRRSYEVDLQFYKKFIIKSKLNKKYFSNKGKNKKLFDLRKFVSDKLKKLDVIVDHINRDTFKEENNFFSYRRSSKLLQKDYGRCISTVCLL